MDEKQQALVAGLRAVGWLVIVATPDGLVHMKVPSRNDIYMLAATDQALDVLKDRAKPADEEEENELLQQLADAGAVVEVRH